VVMGKKSLKIVNMNQIGDGSNSGKKPRMSDDDDISVLQPPVQQRPRPPAIVRTQNTVRDPKSDDMAKMIGKLAARLDFLEQGQGGEKETPKALKDRIRLLEENAIKSIHGDENEFVRKPYLKAKIRPLEDRIEPLESYCTEIDDIMNRVTKMEEKINNTETKFKTLKTRLDSLEESVATKVIKAIKDSSSSLGAISKSLNLNGSTKKSSPIKVKSEPGIIGDHGEEISNLKQQFNNMDILVTRSIEETTKSSHFLAARIQKLEQEGGGAGNESQMELIRQNSSNLNVLSARVEALEEIPPTASKRALFTKASTNCKVPDSSLLEQANHLTDMVTIKTESITDNIEEANLSFDKTRSKARKKDLDIRDPKILENSNGLLSVNFDDVLMNANDNVDDDVDVPYNQIMDMLDEMQTGSGNPKLDINRNPIIPAKGLKILQASQINAMEDKIVSENGNSPSVQESSEDSISQLKITNVESALDSSKGDSSLNFPSPDDPLPLSPMDGEAPGEDKPTSKKKSPVKIKLKSFSNQNSVKIRDNTEEEDISFSVETDTSNGQTPWWVKEESQF